jgi:hypothetical protein
MIRSSCFRESVSAWSSRPRAGTPNAFVPQSQRPSVAHTTCTWQPASTCVGDSTDARNRITLSCIGRPPRTHREGPKRVNSVCARTSARFCGITLHFPRVHRRARKRKRVRRGKRGVDQGRISGCSTLFPSAREVTAVPPVGRTRGNDHVMARQILWSKGETANSA